MTQVVLFFLDSGQRPQLHVGDFAEEASWPGQEIIEQNCEQNVLRLSFVCPGLRTTTKTGRHGVGAAMMLTVYSRLWKDWYNGICHRAGWAIITGIGYDTIT